MCEIQAWRIEQYTTTLCLQSGFDLANLKIVDWGLGIDGWEVAVCAPPSAVPIS